MAVIQYSHGIMTTVGKPTHVPEETQAKLAREAGTFTFYYYDEDQWKTLNLDINKKYNASFITDNPDNLSTLLQQVIDAIKNMASINGAILTVIRTEETDPQDTDPVAPTENEIETTNLKTGDSAIVYYNKELPETGHWGIYDRWVWNGVDEEWDHVIRLDFEDYVSRIELDRNSETNILTPITNTGGGETTGDSTILLAVDSNNAGLMTPDMLDILSAVAGAITETEDTYSIDLTVTPVIVNNEIVGYKLKGDLRVNVIDNSTGFKISVNSNGVYIESEPLSTFISHAAAHNPINNLNNGDYYCLTIDNIEGVASNGKGPIFRKLS